MRVSLRKVVKYSTFLVIFLILNVLVSYNVNLWSFNSVRQSEKVKKSLGSPNFFDNEDNGGKKEIVPVGYKQYFFESLSYRNQRSAKSLTLVDPDQVIKRGTLASKDFQTQVSKSKQQVAPEKNVLSSRIDNKNSKADSQNKNVGQSRRFESSNLRQNSSRRQRKREALDDIFISVKTTGKYHVSRIKLILKTWFGQAEKQTYFFTDGNDPELHQIIGEHIINTNCSSDHSRRSLSCKMAIEFDAYLASRKRWFCHVDDDVYVNIPQLLDLLKDYNPREDWYLGKPSLTHPLEVADRANPGMKLTFWFATGGAGFCISRSLALKMAPFASGGKFMSTAESIRLPDDCTLGYIIEYLLRQKLTIIPKFHSHLENLSLIQPHSLRKQITFSFSNYSGRQNFINVKGFSTREDPTRFRSLHCFLFPEIVDCEEVRSLHLPHGA